ncbi:MAG: biotin synthase BioB [Nitrososphaeraceae archaeon]|nr:biotin synthase BioB [Nitrososphaeraceae archaeon]
MMDDVEFIAEMEGKVNSGVEIRLPEAQRLLNTTDVQILAESANRIAQRFSEGLIDVEMLLNAKSGSCPEDCSFCAQSSFYESKINKYPLLSKETILGRAQTAKASGANSFCLVCAYKSPPDSDFNHICDIIEHIKKYLEIDVNVSLGFMTKERAERLKMIGVKRYNHNLETSETYFSQICTTHDFSDRVNTARIVKEAGLELCCGGIIGMGENSLQRLELAYSIRDLLPDEVPINILIPKPGTPFENLHGVSPIDAIKTIAVWRFLMPTPIIKVAAGREVYFKDNDNMALKAGANGIITGGYLTTNGNDPGRDLEMIRDIGINPA